MPASSSETKVLERVRRLNDDPRIHGLLVQLPPQSRCREMMYDSSQNHSPPCLRRTSAVTSR